VKKPVTVIHIMMLTFNRMLYFSSNTFHKMKVKDLNKNAELKTSCLQIREEN